MLYDKPLWQIIQKEAVPSLPETFSASNAIEWIRARYPDFGVRAITDHLRAMSANYPAASRNRSLPNNVLFKLGPSVYKRYDPDRDGLFDDDGEGLGDGADPGSDAQVDQSTVAELGFALEAHLEEFIDRNWESIDFGSNLRRYEDASGRHSRQFVTDVGVIDFLCEDPGTGDLVVVELKKGRSSDKVLGQCQRYMGWVRKNLAKEGQGGRGLIIAPEEDERLRYALTVAQNVDMLCYQVDFRLVEPGSEADGD